MKEVIMPGHYVYKSNELITSKYSITIVEHRILLISIAKLPRQASLEDMMKTPVVLTAQEYAERCKVSLSAAYTELHEGVSRLYNRDIKLIRYGEDQEITFHWVRGKTEFDGAGRIKLYFDPEVLEYLINLKSRFTRYHVDAVIRLSTSAAFRLYEMMTAQIYKNTQTIELTIEDIRYQLDLNTSYPKFADLRKRVIEPAINEISEKSDIEITGVSYSKTGRNIKSIILDYEIKKEFLENLPVQENLGLGIPDQNKNPGTSDDPGNGKKRKKKVPAFTMYSGHYLRTVVKDGVVLTESEIQKEAREGESWPQVIDRLNKTYGAS